LRDSGFKTGLTDNLPKDALCSVFYHLTASIGGTRLTVYRLLAACARRRTTQ
jgi:hypothetical protein